MPKNMIGKTFRIKEATKSRVKMSVYFVPEKPVSKKGSSNAVVTYVESSGSKVIIIFTYFTSNNGKKMLSYRQGKDGSIELSSFTVSNENVWIKEVECGKPIAFRSSDMETIISLKLIMSDTPYQLSSEYISDGKLFSVATPVVTPVATPVATPVVTPVATPVATPVSTPVATPVATPVSTPVSTPVAKESYAENFPKLSRTVTPAAKGVIKIQKKCNNFCILTGKICKCTPTQPKIKGLAGAFSNK